MTPELLESIKSAFEAIDITAKTFNSDTLFSGLDPDDKVHLLREWALAKGMKEEDFSRAHRGWRIRTTLGDYPDTVGDFVRLYTERHQIAAQFNGLLNMPRSGNVTSYPDVASLERDLRLLAAKLGLPFRERAISDGVGEWLAKAKHTRLETAFQTVTVAEPVNADVEWQAFATALADTSAVSAEYVASAVKALIWQVKRKMADDSALPVYDHVMPILTGPQGGGKTSVVRMILGPVSDLVAATNFAEITDERNFDLWNYPVLFLDEMQAADRSDVEAVKNAITRNVKSGRMLYTSNTGTVRVRSTMLGCTNGTLGDKIADPTGLRRFAPIPVKHKPSADNVAEGLPVVDWPTLNSLDYVKLWQSVDHRAAHPLSDDPVVAEEWAKLCEAERQQDSVEAWLRQIEWDHVHIIPSKHHTTGDLYGYGDGKGYRDWCQRNGFAPVSAAKLGRRMKSLSGLPWYPFDAPKDGKRGTLHVLKSLVALAA